MVRSFSFPSRYRELLTANRNIYVRGALTTAGAAAPTPGNDSNSGLTNDAAGAFLTIGRALTYCRDELDCAGFSITITVRDGKYTENVNLNIAAHNGGAVLYGSFTPNNCVIEGTMIGGLVIADGFKIKATANNKILHNAATGIPGYINFDATGFTNCVACAIGQNSYLLNASYESHFYGTSWDNLFKGSFEGIMFNYNNLIIHDTPAWTSSEPGSDPCMVYCAGAQMEIVHDLGGVGAPPSGAATGKRYFVEWNGIIAAPGQTVNYYPGDVAGTTASQGQYLT